LRQICSESRNPLALDLQDADNTKRKKGAGNNDVTAGEKQGIDPTGWAITKKTSAEKMRDKLHLTFSPNIKVTTKDGKGSLKGPARRQEVMPAANCKSNAIAGDDRVSSHIGIVPSMHDFLVASR
jgi:osmotically-inducible protein OsmY